MAGTRGRPHASSREMIADAALELFFEQGYEKTRVSDITQRTGVSRSSFFNYFDTKADTLWFAFDELMAVALTRLGEDGTSIEYGLMSFAEGPEPETLALAIVDARTMGLEEELSAGRSVREARLARAASAKLVHEGALPAPADFVGGGYASAVIGAVWRWAELGTGRGSLGDIVGDCLEEVSAFVR